MGTDLAALVLVVLVLPHLAFILADRHVIVLKAALAGLIANGAVERVIDQVQFQGGSLGAPGRGGLAFDDEPFLHGQAAGGHRFRGALHLHDAQAAVSGVSEGGMVAVMRDFDPGLAAASMTRLPSGASTTLPSIVNFAIRFDITKRGLQK